jgi:hypothetical protein
MFSLRPKKKLVLISLAIIALAAFVGLWLNWRDFVINLLAGVVCIFIGFIIGKIILDRYAEEQRVLQWEKVRSLTFMSLANHLHDIAQEAGIYCGIHFSQGENSSSLEQGRDYPNLAVAKAMLALCSKMQSLPGADDPGDNKLSDIAVEFYQEVQWNLDQVSNVLLPRVVQSTQEQEVIDSITEFDRARLKLHTAAFVHKRIVIGGIFPDMVNLIKRAHELYNVLAKVAS